MVLDMFDLSMSFDFCELTICYGARNFEAICSLIADT